VIRYVDSQFVFLETDRSVREDLLAQPEDDASDPKLGTKNQGKKRYDMALVFQNGRC